MSETIVGTQRQTVTEPQTVEELDAQVKDLRTQRRALKQAEHQREVLLPQIQRRLERLRTEIARLQEKERAATGAAKMIAAGELTDYRVRAPRKPKKPVATP